MRLLEVDINARISFDNRMIFDRKHSYTDMRNRMVDTQIAARGIRNPLILNAMRNVERHRFVPEKLGWQAYSDYPLPLPGGQTISQPYIVAFMTDAVEPTENDRALEIGTGSGYQSAVLAELCKTVHSIEVQPELAEYACKNLAATGYTNVFVKHTDGYNGWKNEAPFDIIIVTCAAAEIPEPLTNQLANGGRMIIPVESSWCQELVLIKNKDGKLTRKHVLPVRFVPMISQNGIKY